MPEKLKNIHSSFLAPLVGMLIGLSLIAGGCSKVDHSYLRIASLVTPTDSPQAQQLIGISSIMDTIVAGSSQFSILQGILIETGLDSLLRAPGHYTLFAPVDWNFAEAGISKDSIAKMSVEERRRMALFFLLDLMTPYENIEYNSRYNFRTRSGDSIFMVKLDGTIYTNGISLARADIQASNGIIHLLGGILVPPNGNMMQILKSDTTATFFSAAIAHASTGTFNLSLALSGADPLTALVPTNQAFHAAGFKSISDIEATHPDSLAAILKYHLLPGRIFGSDMMHHYFPFDTFNGTKIIIAYKDPDAPPDPKGYGLTVTGNIIYPKASFQRLDKLATNGVVHFIDQVMFP
jgi:uncharacterized surface protein with fasciclin (FAS1) repeats